MVLGLLLMIVGAVAIVAAVFTVDGSAVEFLGFDITALGLYFIGLASGVAVLWGFGLTKWGTKRTIRQRRDSRRLSELSEKLDQVETGRHADDNGETRQL